MLFEGYQRYSLPLNKEAYTKLTNGGTIYLDKIETPRISLKRILPMHAVLSDISSAWLLNLRRMVVHL